MRLFRGSRGGESESRRKREALPSDERAKFKVLHERAHNIARLAPNEAERGGVAHEYMPHPAEVASAQASRAVTVRFRDERLPIGLMMIDVRNAGRWAALGYENRAEIIAAALQEEECTSSEINILMAPNSQDGRILHTYKIDHATGHVTGDAEVVAMVLDGMEASLGLDS